jgi:hypothetical protein
MSTYVRSAAEIHDMTQREEQVGRSCATSAPGAGAPVKNWVEITSIGAGRRTGREGLTGGAQATSGARGICPILGNDAN